MASIGGTATRTGMTNAAIAYTISDAEFDRVIAAYQSDANVSVNGTATRAQVLAYMFRFLVRDPIIAKVKAMEVAVATAAAAAGVTPINPS